MVHRVVAGDEDGERGLATAPGAPRLLPGRCYSSRISHQYGHVEAADVDPELEGVGRDDGLHHARAEVALDLAAELGEIAASVAADQLGVAPVLPRAVLQILDEDLDLRARADEEDGLVGFRPLGRRREDRGELPRLLERVAAQPRDRVQERRIIDGKLFFAARRAVALDDRDVAPRELAQVFGGIGDGGARRDESWVRPVVSRDADEAPQDVRHVRAEDSAERVHLVQHHISQAAEEVDPLRVVREDPLVEHPWIGDDHISPLAQRAPHRGGGVTVVGEAAELARAAHAREELGHLRHLVLRKGFCWEEVERLRRAAGAERRVEGREVVREGLPRGRGRYHTNVAPRVRELDRLPLVGIEARDAARCVGFEERRVGPLRKVGELPFGGRDCLDVDEMPRERGLAAETLEEAVRIHGGGY